MKQPLIMTPGPTEIHEDVRKAMSKKITNPDLDLSFFEKYKSVTGKLQKLLGTSQDVLILSGEGMLGLEAPCASLIEPGDRVLCINNGIFGKWFAGIAKTYGAEVVMFKSDNNKGIDFEELKNFLENDSDFKLATAIHCETPSGVLNPMEKIGPLLSRYGIISVVDTVSSAGGEVLEVDKWKIDIAFGASQKCLSAAPGLTFLSISHKAWNKILNRKTPIASLYCNLAVWKDWYRNKDFPYTQSISSIYGLDKALDRLLEEEDYIDRHRRIGTALRKSIVDAGLELYAENSYSNTVTSIKLPQGTRFEKINKVMVEDHNIMLGGAFDDLEGIVFRIGNMGEGAKEEKIYITLKALDETLKQLRVNLDGSLHKHFVENIDSIKDNKQGRKILFSSIIGNPSIKI